MRIGELLIQQKLLTPEGLAEALEAQVVHGGRLGTNLVELGLIQEKDLAKSLGQQHGVAFASGEMIPDPRALELISANYADQMDLLPMRVEATRLSVATMNPRDLRPLDAIAFKTGKRVVPVVIPEFRMNQLLRKYCKAFRTPRAIDLGQVVRPKETEKLGRTPGGADLMSEDEFQAMYAQVLVGESPTADAPGGAAGLEIDAAAAPERASPEPVPEIVPEPSDVIAPVEAELPVIDAIPEAPVTPLRFAEAQGALMQSSDREDVARTVLRFASGKWQRTILLAVQGDLVTGWRGMGKGLVEPSAVQRIAIALRTGSTLKLVRDTRSHFVGPVKKDRWMDSFYKQIGEGYPKTAVLLPLLVRGKVVHILYVDNGADKMTPPDVGELLILSQSVARSYEEMIRKRRAT